MKRKKLVLLITVIVMSVIFVSCGNKVDDASQEKIDDINSTEQVSQEDEEKEKEVVHNRTLAEWAKAYTSSDSTWSVQPDLKENDNGEVIGTVAFKFYMETYSNLSLNDPEVKQACFDAMDDLMFALKKDLEADNYTIDKITGSSSQYSGKTITIP